MDNFTAYMTTKLVINTIGFICINKQMYNIYVILEYSKKILTLPSLHNKFYPLNELFLYLISWDITLIV